MILTVTDVDCPIGANENTVRTSQSALERVAVGPVVLRAIAGDGRYNTALEVDAPDGMAFRIRDVNTPATDRDAFGPG